VSAFGVIADISIFTCRTCQWPKADIERGVRDEPQAGATTRRDR